MSIFHDTVTYENYFRKPRDLQVEDKEEGVEEEEEEDDDDDDDDDDDNDDEKTGEK